MTLEEFAKHFEQEVQAAIEEACRNAAQEFRERTPPQMTQTRAAVYYKADGSIGIVGLRFRRQYNAAGTATQKRLRQQWLAIRPMIRKRFIARVNEVLKG